MKTNYGTTDMMITKKGDYDEHHGYIRVACSLLSEDFKFNEILLTFQHVPYTHTAEKSETNYKKLYFNGILKTKRLIDLQSAIAHLPFKLLADLNNDNKKDLKWILMNELVQIFDKLITAVPGSKGDFNITRTIDTNDLKLTF
ncbi:14322_t:CDS:2 [Entrophospora sp. SA101]|nr:14322_t:CDS:2 [Entrophospora sp. SA101]